MPDSCIVQDSPPSPRAHPAAAEYVGMLWVVVGGDAHMCQSKLIKYAEESKNFRAPL